jgi:hypothetical protein
VTRADIFAMLEQLAAAKGELQRTVRVLRAAAHHAATVNRLDAIAARTTAAIPPTP